MTVSFLPNKRRGWPAVVLLVSAWAAVAACSTDDKNDDDNPATGGSSASGGGPATGGAPATGGEPSDGGVGGESSCPGRQIDGDVPSGAGGAIAFPCRDYECEGNCESGYSCNENVTCEDDEQVYCNIHGRTFVGNSNCAQWATQYEGECELFNCDLRDVPCDAPAPASYCGMAREVVSGQLGDCVPVPQCACSTDEECPDPELQACTSAGHCEYRSRITD